LESAVYNSGCLRVSDEILAVNLVDVTKMSLDDVVIIMSIPRRLVLAIRTRRGRSNSPPPLARSEQKPPVVVIKRDLRDDQDMMMDEPDHVPRSRSSRERRTGDGREMSESRSRLGLGLTNYSPQSEQLDLYYNSRSGTVDQHTPSWGYKPPAPPSVITEQPKGAHQFQPSHAYYQNAGTLESLAEKVHSFYPGPSRRMSDTRAGVSMSQSHQRFPRSGSADILPRVEYSDFSASLGRHSFIRSSMKSGAPSPQGISGGTLGRYGGRYDQQQQSSRNAIKYSSPTSSSTLGRHKQPLDYSSDTEATISRPNYYYYNNRSGATMGRGGAPPSNAISGGADFAKFNSLPRNRNDALARMNLRSRLVDRIGSEDEGNLSAPEYSLPAVRRDRGKNIFFVQLTIYYKTAYSWKFQTYGLEFLQIHLFLHQMNIEHG
jgi:Rho GTPase-activating protein SYDE